MVLSCEKCKIFKKTFFKEHLWTTATVNTRANIPKLIRRIYIFLNQT